MPKSQDEFERFFYAALHDLKSPLRAITNLSQWIEEAAGSGLEPQPAEHLRLLRLRAARMARLLDDLLAYFRAGQRREAPESIDLASLAGQVWRALPPMPGIRFEVAPGGPALMAPAAPLALVLSNLIGNALKHHGRPEGLVRISSQDAGAAVEISVADDGPGIAAEKQALIFEPFQALKAKDEEEGSGMGLALVKKIVEFHGGSVRVQSAAAAGATFTVAWPKPATAAGSPGSLE